MPRRRLLRLCDREAATLPSSLQRCEIDWRCCCAAEEEYEYVDEIGSIRNSALLRKKVEYNCNQDIKIILSPHHFNALRAYQTRRKILLKHKKRRKRRTRTTAAKGEREEGLA